MQCLTCGTLLSDGITSCPACGATMQLDESKSPYELEDEAIPYIDYAARRATSTAASAIQPAPPPISYGASQVPTLPGAILPGTSLPPQQSVAHHTQPLRGISAGIAALLVVLAFLLVGGGGFGYYLTKVQPAELNAQATSVVQQILTAQAQASAEAIAAFTAKSPQEIYTQVTSRQPDFSDPLSQQDTNTWVNFNAPTISCFFMQGAYHALDTKGPSYSICPATNSNFSNFAYQVQMKLLRGDGGGLLFRMDIKHNLYYRFVIHRDGKYILYANHSVSPETVVAGGSSNVIQAAMSKLPSPSFTATIIAFDSYIYLYFNGQFLAKANDDTVGSGSIGVGPISDGSLTETEFSNVKVWIL
jgi:hypothetical protein